MGDERIASLRKSIANMDRQLLEIVSWRLAAAQVLGRQKAAMGLGIHDEEAARKRMEQNLDTCDILGLDPEVGRELTELLIRHSEKVQEKAVDEPDK